MYFRACDRLDAARRQNPSKSRRVAMLTYAVGVLLDEAQDALAGRERSVDEKINSMFSDLRRAFGHTSTAA